MTFIRYKSNVQINQAKRLCSFDVDSFFYKIFYKNAYSIMTDCPYCHSKEIIKYGHFANDRQRYKCKACNRTFNPTTDSILKYTKKKIERWLQYIVCMNKKFTIRRSAAFTKVSNKTAFYWRHKILKVLKEKLPEKLGEGIVEIKTIYIEESFKGKRYPDNYYGDVDMSASRNDYSDIKDRRVSVLCCEDKNDTIFSKTICRGQVSYKSVERALKNKISKEHVMCTDNHSAYISFAKINKIKIYKTRYINEIINENYHIKNSRLFEIELKSILSKCRGVCTRYLNFYIAYTKWSKFKTNNRAVKALKLIMNTRIRFRNKDLNYVGELG